jgi:hypothetical protein
MDGRLIAVDLNTLHVDVRSRFRLFRELNHELALATEGVDCTYCSARPGELCHVRGKPDRKTIYHMSRVKLGNVTMIALQESNGHGPR